jgi:hypothetical protein
VTIFFSVPAAEVETNLQRSLKNLEKMECRDTGEVCQKPPKRALRKLTRTLRANETYYDVFWWPPTPPRQRVSQGGGIVPQRSSVRITVGSVEGWTNLSYVELGRTIRFRQTLHIPHTEIPFGRGIGLDWVLYPSDVNWLRNLMGATNHVVKELPDVGITDLELGKEVEKILGRAPRLAVRTSDVPDRKPSKKKK